MLGSVAADLSAELPRFDQGDRPICSFLLSCPFRLMLQLLQRLERREDNSGCPCPGLSDLAPLLKDRSRAQVSACTPALVPRWPLIRLIHLGEKPTACFAAPLAEGPQGQCGGVGHPLGRAGGCGGGSPCPWVGVERVRGDVFWCESVTVLCQGEVGGDARRAGGGQKHAAKPAAIKRALPSRRFS